MALNTIWFYGARGAVSHPVLAMGGAALFMAWVVALTVAWRRASRARIRQAELGIVLERRDPQRPKR